MPIGPGFISWLAPPLLGAIVGLGANAIAVRVLTRSSGSSDLAQTIGDLVASELLTEDAIRAQVGSAQTRASLLSGIASLTSGLLDRRFSDIAAPGGRSISRIAGMILPGLVESEGFRGLARSAIKASVDRLSGRRLDSLLGEGAGPGELLRGLAAELASEASQVRLREGIEEWITGRLSENRELGEYLSAGDAESLAAFVTSLFPAFAQFLVRWLRSEPTKRELTIRGRFLVRDIVDRLTGIQRLIVSAAQFDRTLDANMEGIIEDALGYIEEAVLDEETGSRFAETVRTELASVRSKGLGDSAGNHADRVKQVAGRIAGRLVEGLSRPGAIEGLSALIVGRDGTLGDLLGRISRGRDPGDYLADLVLARTGSGQLKDALGEIMKPVIRAHGDAPLGGLLGIDGERKQKLDELLADGLVSAVSSRIHDILEGVNFRAIVVAKIEGLKPGEMQAFFGGSIQKQKRYAAAFGGVVGALIGCIADLARLLFM